MGYREPVEGRLFLDRYGEVYMVMAGVYAPHFRAICVNGQLRGSVRSFSCEDMVIEWLSHDASLRVVGDEGAES